MYISLWDRKLSSNLLSIPALFIPQLDPELERCLLTEKRD